MTIQECYQQLGGDYEDVKSRLPSEGIIKKFAAKFLDDKSFSELCSAMEENDRGNAFRASHTLKGVCANLGFTRLLQSSSGLTELLRGEETAMPSEAGAYFEEVKRDYEQTVDAIRSYIGSEAE